MKKIILAFCVIFNFINVNAQQSEYSEPARTLHTKYKPATQRDPHQMQPSMSRDHSDAIKSEWQNYWSLSASKVGYKENNEIIESDATVETQKNADGTVTAQWSDGTKYRGQMYYGEIKGVGTMIYADGSKYCGEWAADLPNGNGTFMTPEGVIYSVKWVNGLPHGKGVIQDLDGRKYSARWVRGVLKEKSIKPLKDEK